MKKVLYVFSHLEDADVDWMAAHGRAERVSRGATLITEGRELDSVFFLLEGSLAVGTAGAGEISRLEWGEIVGEMSLVDGRAASATVTALDESTVLRLPRQSLEAQLKKDKNFASRFYHGISVTLSERLRSTLFRLDARGSSGEDELSLGLLDQVHLAGARFDRLLKSSLRARHE